MASERSVQEMKNSALKHVSKLRVTDIACDIVNILSPTGYEKDCADHIIAIYNQLGLKVIPQEFDEERANAIGIMKGDGTGPTLMLNGHLDTSYVGDEQYLPDKPGYKSKAIIDGDWIYGLGIYNMKGGLAAFLHAAEAIKAAFKWVLKAPLRAAKAVGKGIAKVARKAGSWLGRVAKKVFGGASSDE